MKPRGNPRKKPNPTNFSNLRSQQYLNQSCTVDEVANSKMKLKLFGHPPSRVHKRIIMNSSRLQDDNNKENIYGQILNRPQTSRDNTSKHQKVLYELNNSPNYRKFSRLSPKIKPFDLVETDLEDSFLIANKPIPRHRSENTRIPQVLYFYT